MPATLDYRVETLKARGTDVDWVCITGMLVESALVFAQKWGLGSLAPTSLPETLSMTVDGYRGEREVLTHPADRALACHLAKGLRCKEHAMGFAQLAAKVPVLNDARQRLSDHDQVLELVDGSGVGRLSVEIKTKRVRDVYHRDRIRGWIQTDAASAWWERLKTKVVAPWSGRMVILISVPPGSRQQAQTDALQSPVATFCDVLMNWDQAQWRGVWGWPGSMGMAALRKPVALVIAPVLLAPAPTAKAKAVALPRGRAAALPRKKSWNEIYDKLKGHFFERRGVRMCSVPMLLNALEVPKSKKTNLGRDLATWKRIHGWTVHDVDSCKRKGIDRVPGGTPEFVATKAVLEVLYNKY